MCCQINIYWRPARWAADLWAGFGIHLASRKRPFPPSSTKTPSNFSACKSTKVQTRRQRAALSALHGRGAHPIVEQRRSRRLLWPFLQHHAGRYAAGHHGRLRLCRLRQFANRRRTWGHRQRISGFGRGNPKRRMVPNKSRCYGRPFVVAQRADGGEGGHSLGLFALTAQAVGLWEDVGECVDSLLPNRRLYEPSPKNHDHYQELFQVYRSLSRKLMDRFC